MFKELIAVILCVFMIKIGFSPMSQTQAQSDQAQVEKQTTPQSVPGKEVEPTKKKKFPWLVVGLVAVVAVGVLALVACKNPNGPDPTDPPQVREYRDMVIAVYNRDPAKIVTPWGDDKLVFMPYELFDPSATSPLNEDDRQVMNSVRYGVTPLIKIAENTYSATLRHVLIDKNAVFSRHVIYVHDVKVGYDENSALTPYGITVEGEYDTKVLYFQYCFRIR